MNKCMFCDAEMGRLTLTHLSGCQHAPEDAREWATKALEESAAFKAQPSCCKLRKKIMLKPLTMPEEYCGIPDEECMDVLTFEKFQGMDVVKPNFCAWCGKPWVTMGVMVT